MGSFQIHRQFASIAAASFLLLYLSSLILVLLSKPRVSTGPVCYRWSSGGGLQTSKYPHFSKKRELDSNPREIFVVVVAVPS